MIAAGLSPFKPESVSFQAGKLQLKIIEDIVKRQESFAFETTLSGLNYLKRINYWQSVGYEVILFFLKLPTDDMAVDRVKIRVLEGGHHIPEVVIRRRFKKGWDNFLSHYRDRVDAWTVFDNSSGTPILLDESK